MGITKRALGDRPVYVTEVIITHVENRGEGTSDNPYRTVREIWTTQGDLIAEYDPVLDKHMDINC